MSPLSPQGENPCAWQKREKKERTMAPLRRNNYYYRHFGNSGGLGGVFIKRPLRLAKCYHTCVWVEKKNKIRKKWTSSLGVKRRQQLCFTAISPDCCSLLKAMIAAVRPSCLHRLTRTLQLRGGERGCAIGTGTTRRDLRVHANTRTLVKADKSPDLFLLSGWPKKSLSRFLSSSNLLVWPVSGSDVSPEHSEMTSDPCWCVNFVFCHTAEAQMNTHPSVWALLRVRLTPRGHRGVTQHHLAG